MFLNEELCKITSAVCEESQNSNTHQFEYKPTFITGISHISFEFRKWDFFFLSLFQNYSHLESNFHYFLWSISLETLKLKNAHRSRSGGLNKSAVILASGIHCGDGGGEMLKFYWGRFIRVVKTMKSKGSKRVTLFFHVRFGKWSCCDNSVSI